MWHFVWLWLLSVFVFTLGWLRQRQTQNAGIVDIIWAAAMGLGGVYFAVLGTGAFLPRLVLGLVVGLWSVRLTFHLMRRHGSVEEGRYQALRKHWNNHQGLFYLFFLGQACSIPVLSLPFWVAAQQTQNEWGLSLILGLVIAGLSVFGEAIADQQLHQHRSQPNNRAVVCSSGLWRYSRHPNYFFEWLFWWTFVVWSIQTPLGTLGIVLSLLGPVVMLLLLYRVSGIPYTEKQSLASKGTAYEQYQLRTSAFIPLPPKKGP